MRTTIIAVVVCAAGAGAVGSVLYGQPVPKHTAASAPDFTTVSVAAPAKTGRLPGATSVVETASVDDATTSEAIEPAAIEPPVASPALIAALKALSARDSATAIAMRDSLSRDSIEWKTLTWAIAISGQTAVPADMIAEAHRSLSGWPGLDDIERNLEHAVYVHGGNGQSITTASATAPLTIEGVITLLRATRGSADERRGQQILADFWHRKIFAAEYEDIVLAEFPTALDIGDHRQRMAKLLFSGRFTQARRFAELTKSTPLYTAFVAVEKKSRDADKALADAATAWKDDPLYLYAAIKRLRHKQRFRDAEALFEKMPRTPDQLGDPGAWWVEARIVSRGLLDLGKPGAAMQLAARHAAIDPDDKAEAEFHAGWYAFQNGDMPAARQHFKALLAADPATHEQARGYYWLGRTAERTTEKGADALYRQAARFPTTYYGQLASAKLGIQIDPALRYPSLDVSASLLNRLPMQAILLLEQADQGGRARRLYLALARDIEDPIELQALALEAQRKHGPYLALAIGKAALLQGHDPGLAAFPLGAIPENADISGAGKALAYAIARQESAFNPAAISPADARGLLQLLPTTAKRVATRHQMAWTEEKLIDDPGYNATLGSHYLGEQIDRFGGSYVLTFVAYNAGPGRIAQWIKRYGDPRKMTAEEVVDWVENIPFQETRDYVQRVMENYQVYKSLLNQPSDIVADLTAGRR